MPSAARQSKADLRTCGSCEWIFPRGEPNETTTGRGCPKCGFASYGAHWVYGHKCYRLRATQQPWIDRQVAAFVSKLRNEVAEANERRPGASLFSP